MSSAWSKGDRKALRQLQRALEVDKSDDVARFALVRLFASKGDTVAAEELLGPGIEQILLADPTTRVAMLSSLGGAYLMLWRARGRITPGDNSSSRVGVQGIPTKRSAAEIRLDVSSERTDLLHRAQHFFEEALTAPEKMNDFAIRAQVGFCREARGDCKEALAVYAGIISDSTLSAGASAVIFRASVLLAYTGRFEESVRYLEFIESQPLKGCNPLLVQALLYTCHVSMGLEMKASRRLEKLRETFNDEYIAGRIGVGYSRDEIPWDRLPGWFDMWRELGVQCLRDGNYYAGIQMFSQATLQREDAETMVCTGEMLWMLGDAKRALALCERAYAADPLHAGAKRRLSGWAPEKWKKRIATEEERREEVIEMQRLAELSRRKADAMLARRRRREKARVLLAWIRVHDKQKSGRRREDGKGKNEKAARALHVKGSGSSASSGSSGTGIEGRSGSSDSGSSYSSSGPSSVRSSRSAGASSESDHLPSLASSLSAERQKSLTHSADNASASTPSSSVANPRSFPVPSATEAAEAGRANFVACFRASMELETSAHRREGGSTLGRRQKATRMAPVDVSAEAARKAICGGSRNGVVASTPCYITQEMRALSRYEWQRKMHEAKITQVVYGL